jgi:hypothetical protein
VKKKTRRNEGLYTQLVVLLSIANQPRCFSKRGAAETMNWELANFGDMKPVKRLCLST